jgi:hypothetical protein
MQTGTRFHIPKDRNFTITNCKTMKLDYVNMYYVNFWDFVKHKLVNFVFTGG